MSSEAVASSGPHTSRVLAPHTVRRGPRCAPSPSVAPPLRPLRGQPRPRASPLTLASERAPAEEHAAPRGGMKPPGTSVLCALPGSRWALASESPVLPADGQRPPVSGPCSLSRALPAASPQALPEPSFPCRPSHPAARCRGSARPQLSGGRRVPSLPGPRDSL